MLVLSLNHLNQMVSLAEGAFPLECCGFLLGKFESNRRLCQKVAPAVNESPQAKASHYLISAQQRFEQERAARLSGYELIGFYHSHPNGMAYFSETDLIHTEEYRFGQPWVSSTYSYLVMGIRAGVLAEYRSFIVKEGRAQRETTWVRNPSSQPVEVGPGRQSSPHQPLVPADYFSAAVC